MKIQLHRHVVCGEVDPHDCYCALPKEEECTAHAIIHAADNAERRRIFKSRYPDESDERIAQAFP